MIFTKESDSKYMFSKDECYNVGYEETMREKIGEELCPATRFDIVDKKLVDVKINSIVIREQIRY